ncbi:type II toxin-antitoxin system RelE/ParE family toxin [Shewanella scandinavica]|uniref:Type II toxin-antitoxin system RelE/ParE family toxin n=1 Tax=Shewanella scandinavica TaxID=3063538 RepID=A0ABU3G6P7_9GAMM|nr:type II toxin-antitoxin system RelE/ParE family toxin [Shewanella sp. SP2S1-2]MDT3282992.1 type II toxin-antitoxin system RelE/ParE family toxin [Shewanella sp. SP2S1-2]
MSDENDCEFHGDSKKKLDSFPYEIKEQFIFAITQLCYGLTPTNIKPLHGLGSGVKEICKNGKPAYRCVYAIKNGIVHILHAFVKTSDGTDSKHENTIKIRYKAIA